MSGPDVSSVIDSILSAFKHGMDIFKRTGRRKHKKHSSYIEVPEDDRPLHRSLSTRPREIRSQYQQHVSKHGQRFEVGDSASQHGLAHILLALNTGLVKILNLALSGDTKDKSMSRKSLLNLSEAAAMDTLLALSDLSSRLSVASSVTLTQPRHYSPLDEKDQRKGRREQPASVAQRRKKPPPDPLLKRGGWVRSSSGSSVVSVVPSPKSRQTERKRSQSVPSIAGDHRDSKIDKMPPQSPNMAYTTSRNTHPSLPTHPEHEVPARPHTLRRRETEPIPRHPSMLIVPKDFFEQHHITPYEPQSVPPPRPPKVPLHSRPHVAVRPRPPSMMTFKTASTKIGEIPEDRLPDRILTAEEQERIPMPYLIPLPLEQPKKKRGFKFWKKTEQSQAVAA